MPGQHLRYEKIDQELLPDDFSHIHKPFQEIAERFLRLLREQAAVRAQLPALDFSDCHLDAAEGNEPLIAVLDIARFSPLLARSAGRLWPLVAELFPALHCDTSAAVRRLEDDALWRDLCLRAVAAGDENAFLAAVPQSGLSAEVLLLLLRTAFAPCIAAQSTLSRQTQVSWRESYCPVCGSDPDLGVLRSERDTSEFLVSKGGQLWLHCPQCLHSWRFVRRRCPSCGNDERDSLTRISLTEAPRAYAYTCDACHSYLVCADMVGNSSQVDIDFLAPRLLHLDAVAQQKGYRPLSPAPWVALDKGQD